MFRRRWTALAAAVVAFGALIYALPAQPEEIVCPPNKGALIVVDSKKHTLALCESGQRAEAFGIRLGKHGTGKTREGDGKTPVGHYALGMPIPSASFGLFVPIGYPTAEQRKLGYTGRAVACTVRAVTFGGLAAGQRAGFDRRLRRNRHGRGDVAHRGLRHSAQCA